MQYEAPLSYVEKPSNKSIYNAKQAVQNGWGVPQTFQYALAKGISTHPNANMINNGQWWPVINHAFHQGIIRLLYFYGQILKMMQH